MRQGVRKQKKATTRMQTTMSWNQSDLKQEEQKPMKDERTKCGNQKKDEHEGVDVGGDELDLVAVVVAIAIVAVQLPMLAFVSEDRGILCGEQRVQRRVVSVAERGQR